MPNLFRRRIRGGRRGAELCECINPACAVIAGISAEMQWLKTAITANAEYQIGYFFSSRRLLTASQ